MLTLPVGMGLFGLCVLGFAVATAIHDTWWLQRKAREATETVADCQDSLSRAA